MNAITLTMPKPFSMLPDKSLIVSVDSEPAVAVFSQNLTIIGSVFSTGAIHVEGQIDGDINAQTVVLGETGRVRGSITSDYVIVNGSVTGDVIGENVQLQASASINGTVFYRKVGIRIGASVAKLRRI